MPEYWDLGLCFACDILIFEHNGFQLDLQQLVSLIRTIEKGIVRANSKSESIEAISKKKATQKEK